MTFRVALLAAAAGLAAAQPRWPSTYELNFTISLPYASIVEPGRTWFDGDKGMQRIEYYHGRDTFISDGSSGDMFEIVPVIDQMTCFRVPGAAALTSLLPDMTNFTQAGTKTVDGRPCTEWRYVVTSGDKVNTYTMYLDADNKNPVQYSMFGYDSLLGSHYDQYVVNYQGARWAEPSPDVFTPPSGMTCGGFPGPGLASGTVAKAVYTDPHAGLRRLMPGADEGGVDAAFSGFERRHGRDYPSAAHRRQRRHLFHNNLRYIEAVNRRNLGFQLAPNRFFDFSPAELRRVRGAARPRPSDNGANATHARGQAPLPGAVDWRQRGAVTPVKDQGICGSCWSFGTTGTIEGTHFLTHGSLVSLSEQNLVDCSWNQGNDGCDGGEDFRAYRWILAHGGIASDAQYGPYSMQDGFCHFANATQGGPAVAITGYVNVTAGSVDALRDALASRGPVSVSIDASHPSLSFYAHGVYTEPDCSETNLDHTVLAVGYGTDSGKPYFIVKNSWSTHWGNEGYVYMSAATNMCGIATAATYVTM